MRFYAVLRLNTSEYPVGQGRLALPVASGDTSVDFGQPMTIGHYVILRSADASGQFKREYLRVDAFVSGTRYNVTRDYLDEHASNPSWSQGTPYAFSPLVEKLPPSYLTPILEGTLAAAVASGDTTVDFGRAVTPGYYAYIAAQDAVGAFRTEHMRIKTLVSGTRYNVARDLAEANNPDPAWRAGTAFVILPATDMAAPPYVIDTLDVTASLRFSTQLHGGFAACGFIVSGARDKTYDRFNIYLGANVTIYDIYGRVVWDGFVTQTAINNDADSLEVTASGYYAKASDLFFDAIYLSPEETVNYIRNPSFENNVTDGGWSVVSGQGGSVVRDTAQRYYGAASAKINQPDKTPDLTFKTTINVQPDKDYVFSFYARAEGLSVQPYVQLVDNVAGVVVNTSLSGLDTAWRRYEFQVVHTGATTTQLTVAINVPNRGSTPKGYMWVDSVQLEQKAYTTPYCDGSLGAYHQWDGAAHNSTSRRSTQPIWAYQVLADCINFMPEWSHITSFVRDDLYDVGPLDFTGKKVHEAIEVVMAFGKTVNGQPRATYFALWEGRIAYVITEPALNYGYPNWFISVGNLSNRMGVSLSLADVYNKVYSVYSDGANGSTPTLPSGDTYSQIRYGTREGFLQNGSLPFTATRAYFLQQAALERYRFPRQVMTLEIAGLVQSSNGFLDFPYRIRAGQTLVITDIDMLAVHAGAVAGETAQRVVGFVLRTEYDASSNITRVDIGSSDVSFDILMSRLGFSGGLS